jgi:hypothetical protein
MAKSLGKKKYDSRPEVASLPDDFTVELPAPAAAQLLTHRIDNSLLAKFNIGWSREHERIVVPLYKYGRFNSGTGIWARRLIGWAGRKIDSPDTQAKPKWYAQRQRDVKHPLFIAPYEASSSRHKTVVIVEDAFSAIRIWSAYRSAFTTMALLTTYLPYELYPLLKGWRVFIWLDQDAYSKSCSYQFKLGQAGVTANTVLTAKDPKAYSDIEIEQELNKILCQN